MHLKYLFSPWLDHYEGRFIFHDNQSLHTVVEGLSNIDLQAKNAKWKKMDFNVPVQTKIDISILLAQTDWKKNYTITYQPLNCMQKWRDSYFGALYCFKVGPEVCMNNAIFPVEFLEILFNRRWQKSHWNCVWSACIMTDNVENFLFELLYLQKFSFVFRCSKN